MAEEQYTKEYIDTLKSMIEDALRMELAQKDMTDHITAKYVNIKKALAIAKQHLIHIRINCGGIHIEEMDRALKEIEELEQKTNH